MSARAAWRLEDLGFESVYDYGPGKEDWAAAGLPTEGTQAESPRAADVARRDAPTCGLRERMADVRDRVRLAGWDVCLVVNEERIVLGILRGEALADEGGGATAEDAMRAGPSTFRPNVPIEEMAGYMAKHDMENVPITTSDGRLVGVLLREDAERAAHELHAGGQHDE
jgi:CBS domain-containing protein